MRDIHFAIGLRDAAEELVNNHHYSRRMPSNIQFVATWHKSGGLFGDLGDPVAAIIFSIPPTRWSENVWELSRLVRHPDMAAPLTGLISAAVRAIKGADLLVSFADATFGHHGGVYQAASWNFSAFREPTNDGLLIDGIFRPGRSLNSTYGTRSAAKVAERLKGHTVEAHWDKGKFLYWRALGRNGQRKAERLGLGCLPYPKPARVA